MVLTLKWRNRSSTALCLDQQKQKEAAAETASLCGAVNASVGIGSHLLLWNPVAWSELGVAAPALSLRWVIMTVWLYLFIFKITTWVALIQCYCLSWTSTPVQFLFLSAFRNVEFALAFSDSSCSLWFPVRRSLLCLRSLSYCFRLYLGILDWYV